MGNLLVWSVICALIANLASGQQSCTSGFISLSDLMTLALDADAMGMCNTVCERDREQRLIPAISFTCRGIISKWIFGADFRSMRMRTQAPELQLWRLQSGTVYTKVGSCSIPNNIMVNENSSRVYECVPTSELRFEAGDVLGIFQPPRDPDSRLTMYYDVRSGQGHPTNYIDRRVDTAATSFDTSDDADDTESALPLVTVEILADCGSLTDPENGQVTLTDTIPGSTATYSCDTRYSLMGKSVRTCQSDGMWSDQPPVCKLLTSSPATPSLLQLSTPPIAASQTSQASSPLPTIVSTPDETVSPTTSTEIEGMRDSSQNPSGEPPSQTSLSVTPTLQSPPESSADTTSPPQESSTASVPSGRNTGSSSSASATIAGAVVGGFIAVLLAFTLIVLLLTILRKKKQTRKHEFAMAAGGDTIAPIIENPVYSADGVPGRNIGGETCTEYTAVCNDCDDIGVASGGVYQSVDEQPQHYEQPEKVKLAVENGANGAPVTGRRNIYSTLSLGATNSGLSGAELPYEDAAGASGMFYQWGVYVPSEEERKNLATGDGQTMSEVGENVYAALGEAQFKAGYVSSGPSPAFFEDSNIYWPPSSDKEELYGQLATKKYREIPRHQVQITDNLGEGQFGTVNKGIWQSPAGAKEVAVKTLKSQASETDAVKFLQEAAINGQFKHPNVVSLFGVVTIGEPVMIVLELLANGDLRHYLNKQQPAPGEMVPSSTPLMLLNFCRQVAAGMEYLARKAFVHRDLAARNILVSEDKTCKVSDFGMSRDLADENYYVSHGGKIPVKWTAPEALHYKKYSTASDVWSFGAVMYEIWSLGHKPFEGRTNAETIKLVGSGYRLPPPPGCPKEIYKWMIRCWHPERHTRPQFSQLSEALNQPDFDLLTWSEEDAGVHPQAMVLGAPLEAGKQLYPELQDIYVEKQSPATQIATL